MKIKVKGEMTIAEIRQALFEMLCKVEGFGVRHSLDATLYIRPTNGFGDDVSPRHPTGEAVTNLYSTELSERQMKRAAEPDVEGRRKLPFFLDPIDGKLRIERSTLIRIYRDRQISAEAACQVTLEL